MKPLNAKQILFAQEYAKGMTAGEAAAKAGYGKTPNSSSVIASRLMRSGAVRRRVELEKKRWKLTERQEKFVQAYASGLTASEAATAAGYAQSNPRQQGGRLLENSQVISTMREKLDLVGVTDTLCVEKILEGLNATKPVLLGGMIEDYPDFQVRAVYLEKALKLRGHLRDNAPESAVVIRINNTIKDKMGILVESATIEQPALPPVIEERTEE